jgi:hypothetical protein
VAPSIIVGNENIIWTWCFLPCIWLWTDVP